MRLIGKCLQGGVLEGVELSTSETGTAQGSVLSPLLGNVYLHYALDLWFEKEVKPRLRGRANLIRYAEDFIIGSSTRTTHGVGWRFSASGSGASDLALHQRLTWERFADLLRDFPLPEPRIRVRIWGS